MVMNAMPTSGSTAVTCTDSHWLDARLLRHSVDRISSIALFAG